MHDPIFCRKSCVWPIKRNYRTQHLLYSVRRHTTVGPKWDDCLTMPLIRAHNDCDVQLLSDDGTSGRNEGGGGVRGVKPPPNVQRTLAFMLSRETLQKILDRKTPQMFYPISPTGWHQSEKIMNVMLNYCDVVHAL